jgi:hypothetical protein
MAEFSCVRLYRPGDESAITELFQEVFAREMSLKEWRWKYVESHPSKVYASVAEDNQGNIVGHYGGVYVRMVHNGQPARGLAICDVMIHPAYRSIRALKSLSSLIPPAAVQDGIMTGYGFPNLNTLFRPAIRLGIYEKVEDVLEGTKETEFHRGPDRYRYRFAPLDYSDERIDTLWDTCKKGLSLSVVRDRKYLVWRYKNHPLFNYELWGMKRRFGARLLGIVVLRREENRVLLIDLLSPETMITPLFHKLENYAFSIGKKAVTLWFPPFLKDKITALGFSTGAAPTVIPRTTYENALKKEDMKNRFFYTMGDTDFL